ncbi:MAG: aldehyde:ferredoxin oxidoreductase [Desulfonauticus sp.]|jgi:aldehyde:ferredoxin oxidoreductase|nr:MAG: Aldehyde ferredoxin oxidoreductase [Desulfonauticus sp. 38_4375]MDK2922263.1 aldehyde:ferredoxin oxidoreductase [Desulfonauticus sp.]
MFAKILIIDLTSQKASIEQIDLKEGLLGGSGLAASLYLKYGLFEEPAFHPDQPLIFTIGPLTGAFPMMSKVVLGFKSPYHEQYAESHAGGRLALALRFAGYLGLVVKGKAKGLTTLEISDQEVNFHSTPFLKEEDVFSTGKLLRRVSTIPSGKRSILRIGPAGENLVPTACINVDTYRHFGRLGAGAVMGSKNLKGIIVGGNSAFDLNKMASSQYPKLYQQIHEIVTTTKAVNKYHDLGTPQNLIPLNELKCLPWNNLQKTSDPDITNISGEHFAKHLLLRQVACAGCPVGCIHIGLLREQFGEEHEFLYHQVAYDYEPIFALGSMLGIKSASAVLKLLEEVEKMGLDAISTGVILAYITEGLEKKVFTQEQVLLELKFSEPANYLQAIRYLAMPPNKFWRDAGKGLNWMIKHHGGEDFACVLGQEMAGYATGENYFVAQALGFRHSHLDLGAYSFDQEKEAKNLDKALDFFAREENYRVILTSCVGCLFARKAYTLETLVACLESVSFTTSLEELKTLGKKIQSLRWQLRFKTGFDPEKINIPKRYLQVVTYKGPIDPNYLEQLKKAYARQIKELAQGFSF